MPRWSIAKARVAWTVGGCRTCGVFVRTIVSSVRFHSITAFGAGASVAPAAGVDGDGEGPLFGDSCATAGGAATARARSPAGRDSLRGFIGCLSVGGAVCALRQIVVLRHVVYGLDYRNAQFLPDLTKGRTHEFSSAACSTIPLE